MKGLTDKQRGILEFIEDFSEREGMAPTVYEIGEYFDIKTSTVFAHVRALQRKQFINRSSKARSITLTRPRRKSRHMSFVLPVPLLGRINAGLPAESLEYKEGEVCCDPSIVSPADARKVFALRIQGESMRDLGMLEGDIVIVKQVDKVKPGSIVVALVDGETTVKSYYRKGNTIELRPANPDFESQFYSAADVEFQGVVIALQRRYPGTY